jgi:hypothetical protein
VAITTIDGLIAALCATTRRDHAIYKTLTPAAAGAYMSLWASTPGAGIPGAAAIPAAGINGEIPTDGTAGAFPFTNPAGGEDTYLGQFAATSLISGTLYLYDRLWHNNFPNATTTGAQAISPSALTRPDANGAGVEAWFQVYVATGAGAPAITIQYTDQDGNTAQTGTVVGYTATRPIGQTFPVTLAAGDTGVRAITSYNATISMSSGTIGLVLRRKIASVSVGTGNNGQILDAILSGLPTIPDDACLELVWQATSTTATAIQGQLSLVQG